jgi:hypothetical protein
MLQTYKARLKGDRLEWIGSIPREVAKTSTLVRVTILREEVKPDAERTGPKMARALEELALSDPPTQIEDPVEWQREIRRDRELPGRDG